MRLIDLRGQLKHLYAPRPARVETIDVPPLRFLMIDGEIEPGEAPGTSARFAEDTGGLYGAAYTIKFAVKKRAQDPVDYPVMALEGLWWVEDGVFDLEHPDNWCYTLMILQPDLVDDGMLADAQAQLRKKKGDQPVFARVRLAPFAEGLCVQALHVGPYATEPETIARISDFVRDEGYEDLVGPAGGKHHEIYLGDPRRADPAKLKTVLRHPVRAIPTGAAR